MCLRVYEAICTHDRLLLATSGESQDLAWQIASGTTQYAEIERKHKQGKPVSNCRAFGFVLSVSRFAGLFLRMRLHHCLNSSAASREHSTELPSPGRENCCML